MRKLTRTSFAIAASAASVLSIIPSAHAAATGDSTNLGPGSEVAGNIARIAGQDRIATSLAAAKSGLATGNLKADRVIIARANDYPDALTTTPLADCQDSPVLLNYPGSLDPRVAAYIVANKVTTVTIAGSDIAISPAVEDAIHHLSWKDASGATVNPKIARVGGIDRYATATFLAKDSIACNQTGVSNSLWQAEALVSQYQEALRDMAAADKAMAAAQTAYAKAVADRQAALVKQSNAQAALDTLAKQLVATNPPSGYASWAAYVNEAVTTSGDAAAAYNKAVQEQAVFTALLGTDRATTLDKNSTLDDYIAAFPDKAAAIQEAAAYFGIPTTTSLNDAIATSNTKVASASAAVSAASAEVAKRYNMWMAAAAGDTANQAVLKQMGAQYLNLVAAQNAIKAAEAAMATANKNYQTASNDWAAAAALAPSAPVAGDSTAANPWQPGSMLYATTQVQLERNALNAVAGKYPAFTATGLAFPDALSAGAASQSPKTKAGYNQVGVVLLTAGTKYESYTANYLKASKPQVVAVGGAAAAAANGDKTVTYYVGNDRYATAALVAEKLFDANAPVAIASGQNFADAVVASAYIANYDGALLLTANTNLSAPTRDYLMWHTEADTTGFKGIRIFGASGVITNTVRAQIADALMK